MDSQISITRALTGDIYDNSPFFSGRIQQQVEFYLSEAHQIGGNILEIGSATGLFTVPLARAGFQVHALDISQEMLELLKEKLDREDRQVQEAVRFVNDDMRTFSLGSKFRLVLMPDKVLLAASTIEDQIRSLRQVHTHLEENGFLILDVFSPDLELLSKGSAQSWCEFSSNSTGNKFFAQRFVHVEPFLQLLKIKFVHELIVDSDNSSTTKIVDDLVFRYIFPSELLLLLEITGFSVKKYYGDFASRKTKSTYSGQQIIIAQKKERRIGCQCH